MSMLRHATINAYMLLAGASLFIWPVVMGLDGIGKRIGWIIFALACLFWSFRSTLKAPQGTDPELTKEHPPWLLLSAVCIAVLIPLVTIPITFFSDESHVIVPGLALTTYLAGWVSWPGLLLLTAGLMLVFLWCIAHLPHNHTIAIALGLAAIAFYASILLQSTSGLAVRYAPLMNIVQSITSIISQGEIAWVRLPNALWTLLLGLTLWYFTPSWNPWARVLAFLTPLLTPLGWTYRILLYQQCGEITIGILGALLLAQLLKSKDNGLDVYLGIYFALWTLYRPSGIIIAALVAALLWILKRRQSAYTTMHIAAPVGFAWAAVYFFGTFQYPIFTAEQGRELTVEALWRPLTETALALPEQMHLAGLTLLIGGSIVLIVRDSAIRVPLMCAWFIGLSHTVVHQLILTKQWYGYGRFTVLLLLPLAFIVAGTTILEYKNKWVCKICGLLLVAMLACVTPFQISAYLQDMRLIPLEKIDRSTTGGAMPTALPKLVEGILAYDKDITILAPDSTFLDVFIASGLITVEDRNRLIQAGIDWDKDDPARPVIIQAPYPDQKFTNNTPPEWQQKLVAAAVWAHRQPDVQQIRWGKAVTYLVP